MSKDKRIVLEKVTASKNEYVIKDKSRIIIGRFSILELDRDNRRCNVNFKFYRQNEYELMSESIEVILVAAFKENFVHKVNFYVNDNTYLGAFLDLGFNLEGILKDNLCVNGEVTNEMILGITRIDYNSQYLNNTNVELETERLVIRNLNPDDSKDLADYYISNKEYLKSFEPLRDTEFFTEEFQKSILIESYGQLMKGTAFDLGIYLDNKLIGKIKLSNIVYGVFKNAFIGYSIDEHHQGKGYMTEAVNAILEFAKTELLLHRIEASVLEDNEKSKSVLRKCGFKEVGLNEKYLFINNKWRNHYTYYKIL